MDISTHKIPEWLEEKLKVKYPHDILFAMDVARFMIDQLDILDLYNDKIIDPGSEFAMVTRLQACTLMEAETLVIKEALTLFRGNVSKAAKHLGVSRSTLERIVKKRGMKELVDSARTGETYRSGVQAT